jgi:hypothetical protein
MAQTVTPVWTDAVMVVAPTLVSAAGASVRGTIDLRSKFGARLYCKIGRLATTVLAASINVYVRPVLNNGATGSNLPFTHPVGPTFQSQIAVTVCPTVATNNQAAGSKSLDVSSGTSMAAGDVICISDSGGTTFTRTEFKTVSKVSSNNLTLVTGLDYAHTTAQADIVSRLADVFTPMILPGGSLYEVVFDYGPSATGGNVVVMAHAQTYDSNTVV